ncbi:MAG: CopD family protein [Pseudomonadota bacterium]
MALLLDIFGFLTVILRGLSIGAQAFTLGGIGFVLFLATPLQGALASTGDTILARSLRITMWAALALVAVETLTVLAETAILIDTADLSLRDSLGAAFVTAGAVKIAGALAISALCRWAPTRALLSAAALAVILGSTLTSHAVARLDDRLPLALVSALHQIGAALWIGGLPCFVMALATARDGHAWRLIGKRYSQLSMVSVALLLGAGIVMALVYIDSWAALYGTAYGAMVIGKICMFLGLLLLGALNFRLVERLRINPMTSITRLRRCAEVEIGVGITVFFAAASLTSLPPAADLTVDRVSLHEIVERLAPRWPPRLESPDHASLALSQLQTQLDTGAAGAASRPQAFVPGAGVVPPRNARGHRLVGIQPSLVGPAGARDRPARAGRAHRSRAVARHWPLMFLLLAGFLFLRSDPETWPLGDVGFWESLRDPEVVQHRIFVLLICAFAIFEWRVRTGRATSPRAAYVFPLITAVGGLLLLTHSHALANVKEELLIEWTHLPLALLGITAGWARWLELRLDPAQRWLPAWIWPICFTLIGPLLIFYREI